MTAIRLPVSFALAMCATATLFGFLALLVAVPPRGVVVPTIGHIDFTQHIPETPVLTIPHVKPPKPRPPSDLPAVPVDLRVAPVPNPDPIGSRLPLDGIGPEPNGPPSEGVRRLIGSTGTDRGPIPEVRIPPDYPEPAKARRIEGWITVRFTVAIDGSVKDIAILDSQPRRIWDSATIRAVANWKYQPAVHDGRPVEQRGVMVTYTFELER